jgi:hypothetical protein
MLQSVPWDEAKLVVSHCCLDDLPNLAPTGFYNALQVLKCLLCLMFDATLDKCASLGIEAEATRDEHKG